MMQLLAVIVPPPEVVREVLDAAHDLCSPTQAPDAAPPARGLLRLLGRPREAAPAAPVVALRAAEPSTVFVRLAKFGNVTGDDASGLGDALASAAGAWPAPVLRVTGLTVTDDDPAAVTAQVGGDVGALRDIYHQVNEVARQQRFFLDRRSFRSELALGTLEAGVPSPVLAGTELPHPGASWSPSHVTLVRASFTSAGSTYAEHARIDLAPGGENVDVDTVG
jgi:hypothetical protein